LSEDRELERLRRRRLLELEQLRRRLEEERQRAEIERQLEIQKQTILQRILTPRARQRLTNLKLIRPEFTSQLELQLIEAAQSGKIPIPVTDNLLKRLLIQLQSRRREIKIRRL